jgi:hypothetical protein
MISLLDRNNRQRVIEAIQTWPNRRRKASSLAQFEIFQDRIAQYVYEYLLGQFDEETVREMPRISSLNIARRIVKQESSLYRSPAKREFVGVSEAQKEVLKRIYSRAKIDTMLRISNEYYKLQNQNLLQIVPFKGEYKVRSLLNHHYDVVPNMMDPEMADGYLISSFDKEFFKDAYSDYTTSSPTGFRGTSDFSEKLNRDHVNRIIADKEDYQSTLGRYEVWQPGVNFLMSETGEILSEDTESPLAEMMPFIDVAAKHKGYTYFVEQGQTITDFAVQFNAFWSDLFNLIRIQGYAQAIISGPDESLPENIKVGPNKLLRLPFDPNNPQSKSEFQFVSPQVNIEASMQTLEAFLATFLSTRGVDPKTISGKAETARYTSGVERLLSLIEKFEASQEDQDIYEEAENKIFEIIKAYNNESPELFNEDMRMPRIPDDAYVTVEYHKPEMMLSQKEKNDLIQQDLELGLISRVEAIMKKRDVSREDAQEILQEIEGDMNGQIARPQGQPE